MANDHGGKVAIVRGAQPLLQLPEFVRVHARQAAKVVRLVQFSPAACRLRWREIGLRARFTSTCAALGAGGAGLGNGSELFERGVNCRVIGCSPESEGEMLIQFLQHQSPGSAVRHAQTGSARALFTRFLVFVADNRLAVSLQSGDSTGNVVRSEERRVGKE